MPGRHVPVLEEVAPHLTKAKSGHQLLPIRIGDGRVSERDLGCDEDGPGSKGDDKREFHKAVFHAPTVARRGVRKMCQRAHWAFICEKGYHMTDPIGLFINLCASMGVALLALVALLLSKHNAYLSGELEKVKAEKKALEDVIILLGSSTALDDYELITIPGKGDWGLQ